MDEQVMSTNIIIQYLNYHAYDYLQLPVGDRKTDNSTILQARGYAAYYNKGVSALGLSPSGVYKISRSVQITQNFKLVG